jgi:hypothetical protein
MYCTLVFVFVSLACVAPGLLTRGHRYVLWTGVAATILIVMAVISYVAAIASARGYGSVLQSIAAEAPTTGHDK